MQFSSLNSAYRLKEKSYRLPELFSNPRTEKMDYKYVNIVSFIFHLSHYLLKIHLLTYA